MTASMRQVRRRVAAVLITVFATAAPGGAQEIGLERLVRGLELPVGVVHAWDQSGRLFVVEQTGRIRILEPGGLEPRPFLDLSGSISCCGERGLLGLAFHPDYARNGFFFVNYTDGAGATVVSRFAVSADRDVADPDSETEVISFAQPFGNHNGGDLAFGPDGFLYIASGDGGSGGDPQNNGQSLDTLLGKILRLDVDGLPVAIPPDNPFVGDPSARAEIWAYGLRNPWRISFDRVSGGFFSGDVGQNDVEEINFQPAGSEGGENYGWRRMEGSDCFNPSTGCDNGSLTHPVLEYRHDEGCSVTGGYRYRGSEIPALTGTYLYADYCSGTIWGGTEAAGGGEAAWSSRVLLDSGLTVSSFGEDEAGELYVVHHSEAAGAVYRVVGQSLFADGFESGDTSAWRARAPRQLSVVRPGLAGTSFALEVGLDGATRRSLLRATQPRRETRLIADFYLSANQVELADAEVEILAFKGAGGDHVRLTLEQTGRKYRVKLYGRDGGALRLIGRARIPKKRATRLTIEWARASSAGAANGILRLFKGGKAKARAGDLATAGLSINELEIGLPDGVQTPGAGSFLLDEFVLTN